MLDHFLADKKKNNIGVIYMSLLTNFTMPGTENTTPDKKMFVLAHLQDLPINNHK